MNRKYLLFSIVMTVSLVLDQVTKWLVYTRIEYRTEEIPVIEGLFGKIWVSWVHAQNTGAAFGMLNDDPNRMFVFAIFTVVALGVLGHMLWQLDKDETLQTLALGLVTSGAVGNAIDRVHKQSVTDFVRVYTEDPTWRAWLVDKVGTYEWPAFNVADAALVVGMILFAIHYLFLQKDNPAAEPEPPAQPLPAE